MQLCVGLEAGLEGSLHVIWKTVALVVVARNLAEDMERLGNDKINEVEVETQTVAAVAEQESNTLAEAAMARGNRVWLTFMDAKIGFNKLSHMSMLWTVEQRWLKGGWFALTDTGIKGHVVHP
ncbi:hypothetical protein ACHAXS_004993 [Conticribra weissflogii]